MKRLLLFLFLIPLFCYGQFSPTYNNVTVTGEVKYQKTQASHGFSVGEWLTIDGSGDYVVGSDPTSQSFVGIVSSVPTSSTFSFATPGNTITLSGLTAGTTYYAQTDGTIGTTETAKPVLIATSTTTGQVLASLGATVTLPAPTPQVQNIQAFDVTSTGASFNIIGGATSEDENLGVIVLMAESPISWTPSNNVSYSSFVNTNFSAGNDVSGGSGVKVVHYGTTESPIVVTGLTTDANIYITAYKYTFQSTLISYNTSTVGVFNTLSFNTLADATTPTEVFEVDIINSFENSIEVVGDRGNGDQIVVFASIDSIPDTNPADGTDPTAGSFTNGTALGNSYCVYKGSASTFSITGLPRDDKTWIKIFEREDTGNLYGVGVVDSVYVSWFYDSLFTEGAGEPPGKVYLENNAYKWYKFNFAGADEANISNGDGALNDLTGNDAATIVGSTPQVNEISFNGTQKTARTGTGTAIDTNHDADVWASSATGFEIHWSGQISDARAGTSGQFSYLYGVNSSSSVVGGRIMDNGQFRSEYNDGSGTNTTTTLSDYTFADGVFTGAIQLRYDFVNDLVTVWIDGVQKTSGFLSGEALSLKTPTTFNSGHDFVIGNQSNAGTLVSNNGATVSTAHFAVTPLLTSDERAAIYQEISFTATTGDAFTRYNVQEGGGFDYETENDTLKLSNGTAAFLDYIYTEEILPDSLQEYIISAPFKIASATTSNPSSFQIGARNATTTEPNYGVWGHLNLDNDAGSFGTVQIFSGTGVTGDANWAFRGGSSGAFVPALDSTYRAYFERKIVGNDAFYSFTVLDYYDSAVFTIGYTEPNRPSSAYYGTTMSAFIGYQGDTEVHVGEFSVTRTSDAQVDTSPPEEPTTDYDFLASKAPGASDSNPCTVEEPCLTVNHTISVANASGGSGKTVGIASGFYPETSASVVGTNISLIEGAGMDNTIIQAGPNMFGQAPQATSQDIALMRLSSGNQNVESHITHVINLKGFTLDGNGRQARQGLYIRGRDGWQINDVKVRNFNFIGTWIRYADDFTVNNHIIENSGGDNLTNPLCNNMNPQVATGSGGQGSNTSGLATWDIEDATFNGGGVYNTMFRSGYAHKAQNSSTDAAGTYVNVRFNDMDFVTNEQSNYFSAGGLMLKTITFELHSGSQVTNLDSLVFENCLFQGGFFSFFEYGSSGSTGGVRMTGNIFDPGVLPSLGNEPFQAIEAYVNNLKFNRNYVYSAEAFFVNNPRSSAPFNYGNWEIHNNIFKVRPKNNSAFGAIIKSNTYSLLDIHIYNNTIWHTSPTLGQQAWVSMLATDGALPASTFVIENNAGYGDVPSGSLNKGIIINTAASGITATVRYNKATHARVTQTGTGITNSNNVITGPGNTLLFNLTGPEFPVNATSYFGWTTNAVLNGTGQGGESIGAWEP